MGIKTAPRLFGRMVYRIWMVLSALHIALTSFLPLFQQLDDGFLHLPGRVRAGEVFPQRGILEGNIAQLRLFDFAHDGSHGVPVQGSLLAEFFQALGLGQRGGGLGVVHGV